MSGTDGAPRGDERAAPAAPFFAVSGLTKRFGALVALNDLSFEVRRHEIFGIAGPNGAGKSTLLNVCSGFLPKNAGMIAFDGARVDGLPPGTLCRKGIVRTFQIPQVFGTLSVEENVEIGATFGVTPTVRTERRSREIVQEVLELTGLADRRRQPAGTVDLLTRKMTMLAAALATQPRIVFLDEPLAGLNAEETERLLELILRLHERTELAFVVVEHKIRALSRLSDRLMVLHFGRCICLDAPANVVRDATVIEVYLGTAFVA